MRKELICISCPMGCAMTAEPQTDGSIVVTGNQCSRGAQYARDELVDPRRVVTATCATGSSLHPRLPVRTSEPCPREKIPSVLETVYGTTMQLPIRRGDIVARVGSVEIMATRTLTS